MGRGQRGVGRAVQYNEESGEEEEEEWSEGERPGACVWKSCGRAGGWLCLAALPPAVEPCSLPAVLMDGLVASHPPAGLPNASFAGCRHEAAAAGGGGARGSTRTEAAAAAV